MKVLKLALVLSALMMVAPVVLRAQNADLDFKLVNSTGTPIHALYICPHDSDEWGDDVMQQDILRDGESVDLVFHPKAKAKTWDLRVEDKEGHSVEWEDLDLTQIEVLTLKIIKGKPVAEWK